MDLSLAQSGGDYAIPVATRHRRANCAAIAYADSRLSQWGQWARSQPEYLGYPRLSLIYKVLRRRAKRLGKICHLVDERIIGLTARGTETRSLRPRLVGEVPQEIAQVDRAVAVLPAIQRQVVRIEYLTSEESVEVKAMLSNMVIVDYRRILRRAKLAISAYLSESLMDIRNSW